MVANNVSVLNTSPPATSGGETSGTFWIRWTSNDGFVGHGWFWEDEYNPLQTNWNANPYSGYSTGESEFERYMSEIAPGDLSSYLGMWDPFAKADFIETNQIVLGITGGMYGNNPNACVEYNG